MGRLKMFGLVLLSAFVVGVVTASAAAAESTPLPLIHTALPGETYPLDLAGEVKSNGIRLLASAAGVITATLVSILLLVNELTALGPALIDFTGAERLGNKCRSLGDEAGVVLVPNAAFHLVYTSLSPAKVLETAALFLYTILSIDCGPAEMPEEEEDIASEQFMSRISEVPGNNTNSGDSTQIQTATHCSNIANGIQEISSYFTDSTIEVTGQLSLMRYNGGATLNACFEIPGTLLLAVGAGSLTKMFTVLL
jgi:hypothetical protein